MTPVQANKKKKEAKVLRNLYAFGEKKIKTPKYAIGDLVRITKKKNIFEKGYTSKWTVEVFTISEAAIVIVSTELR